jgi:YHS domain-containing protein
MTTKSHPSGSGPKGESFVQCKVCTKKIRAGEDHMKVYHAGAYHVVCCASCASKFEAAPEHYLAMS